MTDAALQLVSLLFSLLAVSGVQLGAHAATDCASGFVSLDSLDLLAARISVPGNIQIVFPNINFTCNGVITGVTVLAGRHNENGGTLYPDLQVWRRNSEADGVYNRVGSARLSEELSATMWDVYKHTLDPPLEFKDGDVFGIFQPLGSESRLRVVFQTSSGPGSLSVGTDSAPETFSSTSSFVHYPLVAITADQQECVSGSASLERVQAVRSNLNGGRHNLNDRQSVSPQINFTCDGYITKWIVGANNWNSDNDLYPELQVWRVSKSTPNSYHRVGNTVIAVTEENRNSHIYEYPVDPPLPVEAGDLLGIYQPRGDDSRLRVLYEKDAGPVTLYQTPRSEGDFPEPAGGAVLSHSSLPLVTVEIAPNPTSIVLSTSTSKPTPPSTSPVINIPVVSSISIPVSETPDSSAVSSVLSSAFSSSPVLNIPVVSSSSAYYVSQSPVPDQIVAMSTFFISPVMSSLLISETPGGGVDMPASFPATAVGGGVAVGVVVAIATLAAVVIVMALVYNNKKRKYSLKDQSGTVLSNPVYESSVGNGQPTTNGHQVSVCPENDYTSDETELENGQQKSRANTNEHFLRNPIYGTVESDDTYSDEIRLEDGPSKLRADSSEHLLNNPIYETAQPDGASGDINNTMASNGEYIYVPTLEQRQVVEESLGLSDESPRASIYSRVKKSQQPLQFFEQEEIYWEPAPDSANLYSQLANHKYREIPRSQIRTTDNLGSGQFGTVDKGVWLAPWGPTDVAVKMLKEGSTEEDRVKFLQEAAIMGQFFHPNVVKLLGVVTVGEQSMIVEEFLPHGALREYLHTLRPVPGELVAPDVVGLCLKFCQEIASGMQYLSKKAYIHRDLSARNILVSQDRVCKVADFGMARVIENMDYYTSSGGQVPIKWTAPEALEYKKYSTASDVWSFGAVMYEIWSLGHKPFEEYSNPQAFRKVMKGFRLPPPPGCPRAVYQLMINCWHPESHSRPSFSAVTAYLSQSESSLLSWSETDAASHSNATTLGAGLENGHNMYLDLQESYLQPA